MTPDNRSSLRKALSGAYWRMRWRFSANVQLLRKKMTFLREIRRIADSPFFNLEWYLLANPDLAIKGVDPARHYLMHGANEGRDPGPRFSTPDYIARHPRLMS